MEAPVKYIPKVFNIPFEQIDKGIMWENYGAPRSEAYYAKDRIPYTYGRGTGKRTYYPILPNQFSNILEDIWYGCNAKLYPGVDLLPFELLFCNRYQDQHQHLGWHADDSPSVDPNKPIVVITFGAEREIWFKEIEKDFDVHDGIGESYAKENPIEKLTLGHGSVLIMNAGMQQTHLHRIPKHNRPCGPRVSLTFRGLTPGWESYTDE